MTTPGSYTTVDGITSRPTYSYTPPAAFFDAGPLPSGTAVFNILDYGAVASATFDNRPAIQSAIDAAHAAGGGMVYVPTGTYGVEGHPDETGGLYLQDNVFLKGDGMGDSVLRVVDGWDGKLTGIVRTPREETNNYGVADLTLDGNRDNTTGKVDGYYSGGIPDETITDHDAWLIRVEVQNNEGYGFDPHERTERLYIFESVAHHNGLDGFVADYIIDGEYRDNIAYANDRHGFNLTTTTNDFLLIDNVAYDNGATGIVLQRGSFDIPLPHNIVIMGGEIYGNAEEGIKIRLSENVLVTGVDIHDNGTYGIRIRGGEHVTVTGNIIEDSSQAEHDKYSAVQVGHEEDGITGRIFRGDYNVIEGNLITSSGSSVSRYGIEEKDLYSDHNVFTNNVIENQERGLAKLFGDSTIFNHVGSAGADDITGSNVKDVLNGGAGDDILEGKDGADYLQGGAGGDDLDGGSGTDRVTYSGSTAGVEVNLATGTGTGGDAEGDTIDNVEGINGSHHDDTLTGDSGNNKLVGLDGNDTLYGGAGNDTLRGGEGADHHDGGEGYDRVDYIASDTGVEFDLQNGTATGGDANGDTFANVEEFFGSLHDDRMTGGDGKDILVGRAGDDVLTGNGGSDILRGGEGADALIGGDGFDRVSYSDSDAGITIDLAAMTVSGGYGDGDTLDSIERVTGSNHDDTISGDGNDNKLSGRRGNDELDGLGGDDIIEGGGGNDQISTGGGRDTIVFDVGDGEDVIADFNASLDVLELSGFGLSSTSLADAASVSGSDLILDLGGGDQLTINDVTLAELQGAVIL